MVPNLRSPKGRHEGIHSALFSGTRSLFLAPTLHAIDVGPTGGPEALCLLESDTKTQSFWYGYVCKHPEKRYFVSVIVYSKAFVDAHDKALLFARFDYWMRKRLNYEPCVADGFHEVYRESIDFSSAVRKLQEMVFQRWSDRDNNGLDMRIIDVFGMVSFKDKDGVYPPCP